MENRKVRVDIFPEMEINIERDWRNEDAENYGNKRVVYIKNNVHEPISKLIEWFKGLESEGATHIEFGGSSYDGSVESITMQPFTEREENEEERLLRERKETQESLEKAQKEAKKLAQEAKYERELYLALKEKYEK